MAIFLTGSTGYIGAYIAANLLSEHGASLNLLVRARDAHEAEDRLWHSLQLHFDFKTFYEYLQTRIRVFRGDLTEDGFGLSRDDYDRLVHTTDSVIHCAASLNRKSEKSCLNVNLRGTLEVIKLGMQVNHYHGLRRFSHVSTVAVAGKRQDEVVTEDNSVDWNRSDYDPYARTKKFCEHMIRQLLPDVPKTIFRPSIVLGDSRRGETTQFDMVRAFVFLAGLPALPLRPRDRVDIVNVDFVADAIARLHVKEQTQYDTYHLSSGRESQTFRQITESLAAAQDKRGPIYLPFMQRPFASSINLFSNRKSPIAHVASLMKVFMPYLTFNTVFDNTRVTSELARKPVPFSQYSYPLLKFSRETNFTYPYQGWPAKVGGVRRMMDYILEAWVSGNIERAKVAWILGKGERWQPGKKLKLLFAGYNGTRNTGSDVRPEETLRQLRHILGADNVDFSVMSQNFDLTRGYFEGAHQVHLPDIFPPFLAREIPKHHGVIVVEGSAFKSKFANALTTMIIGSLGTATAQNKLAVGYGSEAGYMDPSVAKMCGRYCKDALIITRNEESRTVLRKLGVPTELGTDTAWTFEPLPPEYGRKVLHDAGWDGKLPVLIVCPINPFWWPVKPSLLKYAAHTIGGAYKDNHYRTLYFHKDGTEVENAFERYLTAIAKAVHGFRQRHRVFVALAATEQLDTRACRRVSEKLGGAAVFSSEDHDMFQMVSILRAGHLMASSRFHGIVTSMPALVPSAGITMDERIRNLMRERGHEDLLMNVDDPDLEPKLLAALEKLATDGDRIADGIGRTVVRNLKTMARMGVYFEEELRRRYPDFPTRKGLWSWEDYLPPLDEGLRRLIGMYHESNKVSA